MGCKTLTWDCVLALKGFGDFLKIPLNIPPDSWKENHDSHKSHDNRLHFVCVTWNEVNSDCVLNWCSSQTGSQYFLSNCWWVQVYLALPNIHTHTAPILYSKRQLCTFTTAQQRPQQWEKTFSLQYPHRISKGSVKAKTCVCCWQQDSPYCWCFQTDCHCWLRVFHPKDPET